MANQAPINLPDRVPTLIRHPPPAPVPAPVAAPPQPAPPAPGPFPVATPATGTMPNAGMNPNNPPKKRIFAGWSPMDWYVNRYLKLPHYPTEGNPLWSEVVASGLFWMGITILCMQIYDAIGLSLYMWENLNALWIAVRIVGTIGFVLALLQLTAGLDRVIGVEDTSYQFFPLDLTKGTGWKARRVSWSEIWRFTKYMMRIVLAGILAFAVADVLVDTLTRKAIDHRQLVIEGRNLRNLRNTEVERLRAEATGDIAKLQETEPTVVDPHDPSKRICRTGTRCEARVQLTRTQESQLAGVNAEIRDQRRAMNCEAEGPEAERCGESGTRNRGAGPIFEGKRAALREMMIRRDNIAASHATQNTAFAAETTRLVAERTSKRERDVAEVQGLAEQQLAVRFGDREWREDRSYFGRARERVKMEREDPTFRLKTRTVEIMGVLPFFFLLLQKLFASRAMRRWFSERKQAASLAIQGKNDAHLVHAQLVDGVVDPVVAALDPEHAAHRFQQLALIRKVEEECEAFWRYIAQVAAMKTADGTRYLTVAEAQALLAARFSSTIDGESFSGAIGRLKDAQRIVTDIAGGKTINLPDHWVGKDNVLAIGYQPWLVTAEDLQKAFPTRVDPEPNEAELEAMEREIGTIRREIVEAVLALNANSVGTLEDPVYTPPMIVRALRAKWWNANGEPAYRRLTIAYTTLEQAGGTVPEWKLSLQGTSLPVDPRDYNAVRRYALFPTEAELRALQGGTTGLNPDWTPERRPLPPAPAPQAQPAATNPPPKADGASSSNGASEDEHGVLDPADVVEDDAAEALRDLQNMQQPGGAPPPRSVN